MKRERRFQKWVWHEEVNSLSCQDVWKEFKVRTPALTLWGCVVCIPPAIFVALAILLSLLVSDWFAFLCFGGLLWLMAACFIGMDYIEPYFWKKAEPEVQRFEEELAKKNEEVLAAAHQWREEHPLEEKCRLALTQNPNYVADLITYIRNSREN